MKPLHRCIALSLALSVTTPVFAEEVVNPFEAIHQELLTAVAEGCPAKYEDLYVQITSEDTVSSLWGTSQVNAVDDEQAFRLRYEQNNSIAGVAPSVTEVDEVMASADAIRFECNTHRLNLLQQMMTLNSNDATDSLEVISGIVDAIDLGSGRWETGDIRNTGRTEPAAGWVFLDGRSIGSDSSENAYYKGDQYKALFELMNLWDPENTQNWEAGDAHTLPDLRGRSIYGSTAMGGSASPALEDEAVNADLANSLGKAFGADQVELDENTLPAHTHNMTRAGVHNHDSSAVGHHVHTIKNDGYHGHSMTYSGNHEHDLKQGLYNPGNYGPGTYSNRWPTGGLRPSTDGLNSATLTSSILTDGSHKHSIGNGGTHNHGMNGAGGHDHSISNSIDHEHSNESTGNSAPVNITGPGVSFNVEIKL